MPAPGSGRGPGGCGEAMDSLLLIVLVVVAALVGAGLAHVLMRRQRSKALPREWHLTLRPVFTAQERRMFAQLVEAFPQHAVLVKLPLTRFTQPSEPARVKYWHDLIASLHVTFAICTPAGRVIAAIDIEGPRGGSRRASAIKAGVLRACRVRYLCFMVDDLPSLDEVQRMVLQDAGTGPLPGGGGPVTGPSQLDEARSTLATTVKRRREQRDALWQDSSFSHDSFFAPDSRLEGLIESGFAPLPEAAPAPVAPRPTPAAPSRAPSASDIVGRVVDHAAPPGR